MIKTVKIQGNGYLLNGTMSVPKADGNREYELIKEWLSEGNTPEPEFTEAELTQQNVQAIKAKAEQLITARYPNFKQLNIIRAGGEELVSMSAYIDGIRAISNKAELAGTDVNDINWEVL